MRERIFWYIDTPDALQRWADMLCQADLVAVDTESNSLHSYRERLCLLQMTIENCDVIVDRYRKYKLQKNEPCAIKLNGEDYA